MEIGIDSFAAAKFSNNSANEISSADAIANLLERIEHADRVGLDVFGIGEHHRKEFLDSAPAIILAAAAARTKKIKLTRKRIKKIDFIKLICCELKLINKNNK